jgi:tetratricopeptide (TPR) repeat protein
VENDGPRPAADGIWRGLSQSCDARQAALYARALDSYARGEREKAIADWTAFLETPDAPREWRMWALYNRGFAWCEIAEYGRAIADLTAFLESRAATDEWKGWALYNRGVAWGAKGEGGTAAADYAAVLEMPGATEEQKAKARDALAFLRRRPNAGTPARP